MSCLHFISRSPSQGLLESCLKVINAGDGVIFLKDGVYYCIDDSVLATISQDNMVYGLREDLVARGLLEKHVDRLEVVGYHKFVELTVQYDKTLSWF